MDSTNILINSRTFLELLKSRKHQDSSLVGHLPLVLEVPCSIPACGEETFEETSVSEHAFSGVICRDDTR